MSDINYRPNLGYENDYNSEGLIDHSNQQDATGDSQSTIKNPADRIIDLINVVPQDLAKIILPPIVYAVNIVNTIGPIEDPINTVATIDPIDYDETPGTDDDEKPVIDTSNLNSVDDYPLPNIIFPEFPAFDVIISAPPDKVEEINKQYKNDISLILNDFIKKLDSKISDFLAKVISVLSESGLDGLLGSIGTPYTMKTSDVKDKNLQHVSDTIVRNQIIRDQKVRSIKKLFNLGGVQTHVKSCKTSTELRKRYYSEEAINTQSVLDIEQNANLSNLKAGYDKKYRENFYNLYKYMNSAVIMIDECFKLYIQEAQSKAILSKKEGIKL